MFRWLLYKKIQCDIYSEVKCIGNISFSYYPERCVVEGKPGWEFKRREPFTHTVWEGKSELRMIFEGHTYLDEVASLEQECTTTKAYFIFTYIDRVPTGVQGIPFVIRTVRYEILPLQFKDETSERMARYRIELIGVSEIT